MARARNLKPGFFKDEILVDLGWPAMICFAGLWTLADREGRLEDRPRFIKAEIFPYSQVNVEKLLAALAERKFIIRYEVAGTPYIAVRTWKKHQNPHMREPTSTIPAPCEHSSSMVLNSGENSSKTSPSLNPLPVTLNPLPSNPRTGPSPVLEEGFLEFKKAAQDRDVLRGSEQDWMWALGAWRSLDFENRERAYKDLVTRPEDSPELRSLPNNYLKERKFTRPMPKMQPRETAAQERLRNA